jgi:hypothetical protein
MPAGRGSAHLVQVDTTVWDTEWRVNVAGPASDARMKTSTSATTATRVAAPTVQPSFKPAPGAFEMSRSGRDHHKSGRSDPDS